MKARDFRQVYEASARCRKRDECRDATGNCNHNGETEVAVEPYLTRNQACHHWWQQM